LNVNAVLHCGGGRGKLDHDAISGGLDQRARELRDRLIEQIEAARSRDIDIVLLLGHESRISLDISNQNCVQFMILPSGLHVVAPERPRLLGTLQRQARTVTKLEPRTTCHRS